MAEPVWDYPVWIRPGLVLGAEEVRHWRRLYGRMDDYREASNRAWTRVRELEARVAELEALLYGEVEFD